MKKTILLLILLSINYIYSQELVCGTEETGKALIFNQAKLNQAKFINNNNNYVFKVKIHYINDTNGNETVSDDLKEISALDIVGVLNLYFKQQHIYFKYNGYDTLTDDLLFDYNYFTTTNDLFNHLTNEQYIDNEQIDIFISHRITNYFGKEVPAVCHKNKDNNNVLINEVIFITNEYLPVFSEADPTSSQLANYTLIHEVGHYFGLYHTHQRWTNVNDELVAFADTNQGCDYFEENLDGTESNILGDFLSDTQPDRIKNIYDIEYDPQNCSIISDFAVSYCENTIDFTLFNPSTENIMAYYKYCRTSFSGEQFFRMRAFIDAYSQAGNFLENALFNIDILYEPYYTSENYSVKEIFYTDANALDVGVPYYWMFVFYEHRFQKGFDYDFYDTYDENFISYEYAISSPSHVHWTDKYGTVAVKVPLLGDDLYEYEPRKSWIPGPTVQSTTIITSDIYRNNQTTKELNEIESNSQNLFNNLETNKLHMIIRHLNNGETDTKTIYKTQN